MTTMDMRERLDDKIRQWLAMGDAGYGCDNNKLIDAILDELENPTPEMVEAAGRVLYGDYFNACGDEIELAAALTAAIKRAKEG